MRHSKSGFAARAWHRERSLGLRISKGAQCSNWAREALSTKQIVYAATDAWISRELYLRFVDLGVL